MKIIFVNRFFFPDHSATSQMLSDLTFSLAQTGRAIAVLTSRQAYDNPMATFPSGAIEQSVRVVRVWSTRFGRQHLLGRAMDYLTFYISALWGLITLVRRGDVIVAKTDPPLISVVAALVAWLRGAFLINWIQDLFPEVASALVEGRVGTVANGLQRLRNWSLLSAKHNVVIGEKMRLRLQNEGVPKNTITVIHNWADGDAIYPIDREDNEIRREWNLADKFVVGYSGNFGRAHEFGTILSAAEILRDITHVVFLFIGAGAQLAWMRKLVETKRLENVLFKPYQPRDRLSMSLSVPDIHVISLLPALEGLIVPSKFYGIAAAGRAILYIGDKAGEIPQLLKSAQCGFSAEVHQDQEAAAVIRMVARDEALCRRLGHHARILFDQRFDMPFAEREWQRVITEAMSPA